MKAEKRCSMCQTVKSADEFGTYRNKGRMNLQARCRPCDSKYQSAWQQRRRREVPDAMHADDRRKRLARADNPERMALHRDYQRTWKRQADGITPDRWRISARPEVDMVETAPIREAWEALDCEPTISEMAGRIGCDEATIRRALMRQETMNTERARQVLDTMGMTFAEVDL